MDALRLETRISIVIVSYNRPREVQETVRSLFNQSVKPFEILVIDDGSDPPLKMAVDFPDFKLIRFDKEQGLSNSRNFGINAAKGEYVAFLDDDTVPSQHWLEAVQNGISSGADVMGGPLRPLYKARPPSWWTEKDFGYMAGVGNIYGQRIWGANMIFKKNVFNKIGFFDSRLGRKKGKLMSCEEDKLIKKARLCCHYLFLPEAEVLHLVPSRRMTLNYIIRWNYYEGKSTRILNGRRTIKTLYDILMIGKNMLNPFLMFNKSARIKQIAEMVSKFSLLL
ncbi:MAG: glycosyltransferase family 2 protein [Candidatus Bathyarchaeia archaeon]